MTTFFFISNQQSLNVVCWLNTIPLEVVKTQKRLIQTVALIVVVEPKHLFLECRIYRLFQTFYQTHTCTSRDTREEVLLQPVCLKVQSKYVSLCKQTYTLYPFILKLCVLQEQIYIDVDAPEEDDEHKTTDQRNKRLLLVFNKHTFSPIFSVSSK